MHEYSIVSDLVGLVQDEANRHDAKKVFKIVVALGERSGVDASLLMSCFDTFKDEDDLIKDSILDIVHKRIKIKCNDCASEFYADNLSYGCCVRCNSYNVDIIEGYELHLLSIEME